MRLRLHRLARGLWRRLPLRLRNALRPLVLRTLGLKALVFRDGYRPGRAAAPSAPRRQLFPFVPETVSVIIPTLDAGPLFERVLASVRAQRGLGGLEIVVVDSESSDGTWRLAAAAGARAVQIERSSFGHGRTRNHGAEIATGDVFVMLVQDAVLLGRDVLRALVLELRESPALAAVSARQVPRSDADLYAAFGVWVHERVVWGAHGEASRRRPSSMTPFERRAAGALDNVCAAVRPSAWRELRFADVAFAEDVDFGLRALERGWKVALSADAAVAHSHTRDASYCFRRAIADRLHVAARVGEEVVRAAAAGEAALRSAGRALIREVAGALETLPSGPAPLGEQLAALSSALGAGAAPRAPAAELALLADALGPSPAAPGGAEDQLRADLLSLLGWPILAEFAAAHRSVTAAELEPFVAKLTASVLGRALGDAARLAGDPAAARPLLAGV